MFIWGMRSAGRLRLPKILAVVVALVLLASGARALVMVRHSAGPSSALALAGTAPRSSGVPADLWAAASSSNSPGTQAGGQSAPGVLAPSSGVPLSLGFDPLPGAGGSRSDQGAGLTVIPTPTVNTLPSVARLARVNEADAVVFLSSSLSAPQLAKLHKLAGVTAVEEADTGTVSLAGASAVAFGVDPGTFRSFTPAASAASDRLWQYVAGGSLVSSYEMASDRALKLGSEQAVTPAGAQSPPVHGWLGAIASIGLPGVDLLISRSYSGALGLTPDSGLVVSAPQLTGAALQGELQGALPGAAIELLHPDQLPVNLPGNVLSSKQRDLLIAAALSRVGLPYVWGGAGPSVFDCSGLVQWSYRQAGILMPRTADEQFLTGDHIPLADAQPGDLLFWTYDPNDPGFVDHTAIYLGNGMMVVAPHTGLDVQVVPVPTSDFAGAVAVVLG